jgi:hypothetical protein
LISVLVLAAISVVAIGLPFIRLRKIDNVSAAARERKEHDELLTAYERVLSTIRDLDEDYNTGKLPQATYERERGFWAEQGVAMLQELEPDAEAAVQQSAAAQQDNRQADEVLDQAIEDAIRAYRGAAQTQQPAVTQT